MMSSLRLYVNDLPGKPRAFMPYAGGLRAYRRACSSAAEEGYRGFLLDGAESPKTTATGTDGQSTRLGASAAS